MSKKGNSSKRSTTKKRKSPKVQIDPKLEDRFVEVVDFPKNPNFTNVVSGTIDEKFAKNFRESLKTTTPTETDENTGRIVYRDQTFKSLRLENCGKVLIKNCTIGSSGRQEAVVITGQQADVVIEDCVFKDCAMHLVLACDAKMVKINNCKFRNCPHGVAIEENSECEVNNCTFDKIVFFGVHCQFSSKVTVKNSRFTRCRDGVIIEKGKNVARIFGCSFYDIFETAIACESGSLFLHVNKCKIEKVETMGMLLSDTRNILVENTEIKMKGDRGWALKVEKQTNLCLQNCLFEDNFNDSLYIAFNEYGSVVARNNKFVNNAAWLHIRYNGDGYIFLEGNSVYPSDNEAGINTSTYPRLKNQKMKHFEMKGTFVEMSRCRTHYPDNTFVVTNKWNIYCGNCQKNEKTCGKKVGKFKICSNCKFKHYCSRECQKKHWKEHKKLCNLINPRKKKKKK